MAATVTVPFSQELNQVWGTLRATIVDVTLATNDYVTNGIDVSSVTPSGDCLGAVVINVTGAGALTQQPKFNATTKKLVLVKGTAGADAEVTNGTSDAMVVRIAILTA